MKNRIFKSGEAVANYCGAMEADTISKHGRYLKSQMSRRNHITLILAAAVLAVAITACHGGGGSVSHRNGEVYNPDGIELVYVEGTGSGIEGIKGFYIGKFEVTQAQWQAVMGSNPSSFKGPNLPVETVSWNMVQEFLSRLNEKTGRNYRLPTEAEWEFAARGGTKSQNYEYSGSNDVNIVAWHAGNSGRIQPVGTKAANELGIHDMSGNVSEWCQDAVNSDRVIRGGSWDDRAISRSFLQVTGRFSRSPGFRNDDVGFRVVLP